MLTNKSGTTTALNVIRLSQLWYLEIRSGFYNNADATKIKTKQLHTKIEVVLNSNKLFNKSEISNYKLKLYLNILLEIVES
jgi:hypothetical protein